MLRRPLLSRPPCILNLHRLASTYTPSSRNPSTTLSQALQSRGLVNPFKIIPVKKERWQLEEEWRLKAERESRGEPGPEVPDPFTIKVIDPATQKEIEVDLRKVKPFTPTYALLPLQCRTDVERRYIFDLLRDRQRVEHEIKLTTKDDKREKLVPDPEAVMKYVTQILERRRRRTDTPPNDYRINKYIKLATKKARSEMSVKNRRHGGHLNLTFEEQWYRRQDYAEDVLKPMTPGFIARYNPNRDLKSPVKPRNVTIEQLLAAGSHIGHNKSLCHPSMKPFITGLQGSTHIINLDYTIAHLRRACTLIREVSFRQGIILVIGTRKGHKPILVNAAERMGACLLYRRWVPGTITNGINVLQRSGVKDADTPFRHFAIQSVKEKLADETARKELTMIRSVWNREENVWVQSEEEVPVFKDWKGELRFEKRATNSGQYKLSSKDVTFDNEGLKSIIATALEEEGSTRIIRAALKRGDLAEWMAWEKFATIVGEISDKTNQILNLAQQSFSKRSLPELALDPISEYIPDHGDNWYQRQLQAENDEIISRQRISDLTGDRNPLEMHAMDKFLAKKRYNGLIRGQFITERVKNLETDGIKAYEHVKVFRDGSTMVERQRFDKFGKPVVQYSDGSYEMDNQIFDRDGMRYDVASDSLVFSDGSMLRFEEAGQKGERRLVVVIGQQIYDVSSTVAGSAEKREILEKAADLLESSRPTPPTGPVLESNPTPRTESIQTVSVQTEELKPIAESEEVSINRRQSLETQQKIMEILGGSEEEVKYELTKPLDQPGGIDNTEEEPVVGMQGDEMLEIGDKFDAKEMDEIVENSNRMTLLQERMYNYEPVEDFFPTPFDTSHDSVNHILRPDLIIICNPRENRLVLREAANNQIPTIGIVDTDCDPCCVSYSIPGNDDSLRSVEYILGVLSRAGEEGLIHRNRYAEQLNFLIRRATTLLEQSWSDYRILIGEDEGKVNDSRVQGEVIEQYCRLYGLRATTTPRDTVVKIVAQHIMMAQSEIKRLTEDTKSWSMQQILDQVKTSTQFPGVPAGVLEEIALQRMTESRRAYAEAREKVTLRGDNFPPPTEPIYT